MSPQNNLKTALAPLQQRWNALAQREQNLVLLAGSLVLLAIVWWFAVAPALHSLRTAPARQAAAESQLQTMLQMQAQAELLRQQPQGNQADIRNLLEQSVKNELAASAQLQWLGNRAQVTLTNAPAPALARTGTNTWLFAGLGLVLLAAGTAFLVARRRFDRARRRWG